MLNKNILGLKSKLGLESHTDSVEQKSTAGLSNGAVSYGANGKHHQQVQHILHGIVYMRYIMCSILISDTQNAHEAYFRYILDTHAAVNSKYNEL